MADERPKRRCKAETKGGKPCKAWALQSGDRCLAHADERTRANAGFGGPENGAKGGEAKRVPKLTELLRQRVEEQADEILDKLFEMLDAQRALVVGTGPKAYVEMVPDAELALRAIREIYDRAEGRPKSVSEFTGEVTHRNAEKIDREVERLTERLAEQMTAKQDEPAPS